MRLHGSETAVGCKALPGTGTGVFLGVSCVPAVLCLLLAVLGGSPAVVRVLLAVLGIGAWGGFAALFTTAMRKRAIVVTTERVLLVTPKETVELK
jgi:hypothetical protein